METNNQPTDEQKKGRLDYLSAQLPIITRDKGYAISEGMVEDVSLCNEQIKDMKKEKKRLSVIEVLDMNKEELKKKEGMKTITREKANEILSEKKEEIMRNWNLCECRNAEQNSELEWETQNFAGITSHTLQCYICRKSK